LHESAIYSGIRSTDLQRSPKIVACRIEHHSRFLGEGKSAVGFFLRFRTPAGCEVRFTQPSRRRSRRRRALLTFPYSTFIIQLTAVPMCPWRWRVWCRLSVENVASSGSVSCACSLRSFPAVNHHAGLRLGATFTDRIAAPDASRRMSATFGRSATLNAGNGTQRPRLRHTRQLDRSPRAPTTVVVR